MDYTRPKYWISFLLICFQCATLKLYGHIGKVVNDTMCYYVEQCGIKGDGLTDALSDLNDLIACASRHNIPGPVCIGSGFLLSGLTRIKLKYGWMSTITYR